MCVCVCVCVFQLGKRSIVDTLAAAQLMQADALGGFEVISSLLKLSPVFEEKRNVLSSFTDSVDKLSIGEQLLVHAARSLPSFFARLQIIELQQSLPEHAQSFFARCKMFNSICSEVRTRALS